MRIHDNSASEIAALVERGVAEFGITVLSAGRLGPGDEAVHEGTLRPVVPPRDSVSPRERRWTGATSRARPWRRISPQASNRAILDEALGSRREFMHWRYEVQHLTTAVSLVRAEAALTVAPSLAVDPEGTPGVRAVPIRNPSVSRTVGLVMRRGYPLSDSGTLMLDLIPRELAAAGEA